MPARTFALFAFISFVVVTAEFMVIGLIPNIAKDLQITLQQAGTLVTWFALSAALLGPVVTLLSGRVNSRKFALLAMLSFAIGNLILALFPSYSMAVVVRVVQGSLLPSILSILSLAAVKQVSHQMEGWAISRVNLGVALATVLGIPMGTIIAAASDWKISVLVLSALSFIAIIAIIFGFPSFQDKKGGIRPLAQLSLLLRFRFLAHLILSALLFTGMFSGYTYIAPLLSSVADFSEIAIGWTLIGFGIAGIGGNFVAGRFSASNNLSSTIYVSIVLVFSMVMVVPISRHFPLLLCVLLPIWGASHMAAFVVTQVRVMKAAQGYKGFAVSLNLSVCNLGIASGSYIGGVAEAKLGIVNVGYISTFFIILVLAASIAALCAGALSGPHAKLTQR